ncbi:hypothetical protein LXL04_000522 [Taraxacum kok-saghyz]
MVTILPLLINEGLQEINWMVSWFFYIHFSDKTKINCFCVYVETAPVFFKVLQSHTSLLASNQLAKEMER